MLGDHGQAEVGFVLRIAIGFTVLISMSYLIYTYMEEAEKAKMVRSLDNLAEFISKDIASAVTETPENTTVVKRIYLPPLGDPLAGNYFVTLEKSNSQVMLVIRSYRWRDVGVIKPLFLNSSIVNISGVATPTIMCLNVTHVGKDYTISLVC